MKVLHTVINMCYHTAYVYIKYFISAVQLSRYLYVWLYHATNNTYYVQ